MWAARSITTNGLPQRAQLTPRDGDEGRDDGDRDQEASGEGGLQPCQRAPAAGPGQHQQQSAECGDEAGAGRDPGDEGEAGGQAESGQDGEAEPLVEATERLPDEQGGETDRPVHHLLVDRGAHELRVRAAEYHADRQRQSERFRWRAGQPHPEQGNRPQLPVDRECCGEYRGELGDIGAEGRGMEQQGQTQQSGEDAEIGVDQPGVEETFLADDGGRDIEPALQHVQQHGVEQQAAVIVAQEVEVEPCDQPGVPKCGEGGAGRRRAPVAVGEGDHSRS